MIKKFIPTALIAAILSFTLIGQASAELKIATINTKDVLDGYYKMEELQAELKKDETRIKEDNESKLADIKKLADEIKKLRTKLSDSSLPKTKLKSMEQDYKRKFNQLNQADRQRKESIQGQIKALNIERSSRQARMLEDIQKVINAYAAKNGFDIIFDKGEKIGVVLYAKESFDISKSIQDILNKDKKTAPADK